MHMKFVLAFLILSFGALSTNAQIISTYAGTGTAGYSGDGGQATAATMDWPEGIIADRNGNIFFTDGNNFVVRKIDASGIITTIAGTGTSGFSGDGGIATSAALSYPRTVATDTLGNIYIVDTDTSRIRKVNASGIISTIAGTGTAGYNGDGISATSARINRPNSIALSKTGEIFFTDSYNYRLRKINNLGVISTVAGNGVSGNTGDGGQATNASIGSNCYIALDYTGNIFIQEDSTFRIRKIATNGIITTIAGTGINTYSGDNGPATAAGLGNAGGIAIDNNGNIYFSDENHGRIRKIDAVTKIITTFIGDGTTCGFTGDGGPATSAQICAPFEISIDKNNVLYFCDLGNQRIRRVRLGLGVENTANEAAQITLSPNPATAGAFTLNIKTGIPEAAQITITNVTGSTVSALQGETNKAMEIQLNVPKGLYFVTVATSHGVWVEKVVVD